MKAIVSGQAAKAVYWKQDGVWCLPLDATGPVQCSADDVPYLMGEATDLRAIDVDSPEEVVGELELSWSQDRALHLMFVLLDPDAEDDSRREAAEYLDEFFANTVVREFIVNRFYSAELPEQADLVGAIVSASTAEAGRVVTLLEETGESQPKIRVLQDSFSALPTTLFGDQEARQLFRERAVTSGAWSSVVAWIGAEMEFALSQAVASGDAFEHRPSECGHCVQNFLADRDFRDLPGEAAGFELGADHALPTADLRFYPAALVVPCGRLPGHTAIAADLGNMAIPNGWTPRRLRTDHCVLWRRYNHIQGLPIPFPQQIPCRRPIIGAVSQKARDRGIQLIQKPGQGGAVSSVIVSQIGANNRTAGQVQSEVEFAPAAAYYLDFMLLCEPFPLAEDLEAGTVHHQMDRHRSCLPHHLSDAHPVCATRQRGVIRYPYIQPHERADGSHKSLRLPQRKPIRRAQRQACLDRQIRVSALTTP